MNLIAGTTAILGRSASEFFAHFTMPRVLATCSGTEHAICAEIQIARTRCILKIILVHTLSNRRRRTCYADPATYGFISGSESHRKAGNCFSNMCAREVTGANFQYATQSANDVPGKKRSPRERASIFPLFANETWRAKIFGGKN
jgi:hypothetical protein